MWARLLASAFALVLAVATDVSAIASANVAAERARRASAQVSLLDFAAAMHEARTASPFKRAPHQDAICAALERVVSGECKRLVINVPPRSGKTDLAVVAFIAWSMGRWPDAEFIHASYSDELATSNAAKVREVMQHERFAEFFGSPQFRRDTNAKDHFRTAAGGCVYASGAGGSITGYGAGKMRPGFGGAIVIDDPHKAVETHSATMRKRVQDWFTGTMESRRNSPERTPIIVIMQRLHVDDLSGFLLAGGNGEAWEHVCIPAMDDAGASYWPEQHPAEDLRRLELSSSYTFASQYQQRPQRLGGNLIKSEWFKSYAMPPRILWRIVTADTAQKTKERNDFSVFAAWGLGEDGRAYLLDLVRGRWEAPELERRAVAFWTKHKAEDAEKLGKLRAFYIEDKSSGTGLIQSFRAKASAPVIAVERTKDKLTRLMDVLPNIESGRVAVPEGAPWLADFLAECEAMTADDTHAFDDQVDTMIDGIDHTLGRKAISSLAPPVRKTSAA